MHDEQFPQDTIELKGSTLTVVVLRLKSSDPRLLYPQMEQVLDDAGAFLASAPVVIDVTALDEQAQNMLDFVYLLRYLRGENLTPVGVQGATESQMGRLAQAGLFSITTSKKKSRQTVQPKHGQTGEGTGRLWPAEQHVQAVSTQRPKPLQATPSQSREPCRQAPPDPPEDASTLVVTQPVRAGQQISAPNGDLIVLASVNAGSELFAAGNIHVYGTLRGRALAGVNGDTSMRIFALQGNPELLAIAGEYVVNEELPRRVINQSFAVSWSDSGLRFQVLGSFEL